MVWGMDRWRESIKGSALGLLTGFLITLLALTPNSILPEEARFYAGLGVILLFLGAMGLVVFYQDFDRYLEARNQVRMYLDMTPETVRFAEYDRYVQIDTDGNSSVTETMKVENISDDPIMALSLPSWSDIQGDNDPETMEELAARSSNLVLNEVKIGTYSAPEQTRCYKKEGTLIGDDIIQEHGHLVVPFNEIGGLDPDNEAEIRLEYEYLGALQEAIDGDGDAIAMDTYHPTENYNISIKPPSGHKIILQTSEDHPNGLDVIDIHGQMTVPKERNRVSIPEVGNDGLIRWEVTKPRINYRYEVNFNIITGDAADADSADADRAVAYDLNTRPNRYPTYPY